MLQKRTGYKPLQLAEVHNPNARALAWIAEIRFVWQQDWQREIVRPDAGSVSSIYDTICDSTGVP